VAYAEGEDRRVLRAVQVMVDEGLARPWLVGRASVITLRIEKLGLRLQPGRDFDIVNIDDDPRYRDYWQTYHRLTERKGVTEQFAKIEMRRRLTLIGAMLLHKGEVDGMICGTWGSTQQHLAHIDQIIGRRAGVHTYACMNGLILPGRQVFLVDTHVNYDPTAEQLCRDHHPGGRGDAALRRAPKAALLSHSNFGISNQPSAVKMRERWRLLQQRAPWLEVDGEMHGDAALDASYRAGPDAAQHPAGRGQPAGVAEHRRRQHQLQPAEDRSRRRHRHRPGAAGRGPAGAHPDTVGHGARIASWPTPT
jgi:malate dehydrogenase (oxaloacetate-decarboxylating)(NADP+)